MLREYTGKVYLACGFTDLRMGIAPNAEQRWRPSGKTFGEHSR